MKFEEILKESMTVSELREVLKTMPPHSRVVLADFLRGKQYIIDNVFNKDDIKQYSEVYISLVSFN